MSARARKDGEHRSSTGSQQTESDLTYFIHFQREVSLRALTDLDAYLTAKSQKIQSVRLALRAEGVNLNHRQTDTLEWLARDSSHSTTVQSYAAKYRMGDQTARNELNELTHLGHVIAFKESRSNHWRVNSNFPKTLGI